MKKSLLVTILMFYLSLLSFGATNKFDFQKRTVKLNNGIEMPIIGIGVFMLTPEQAENSVYNALKDGYRLIDTAHIYGNEEAVGKAIKRSGVPREEIFVTTKLWTEDFSNAEEEINNMLKRLDLEYIDLLLLHHPADHDKEAYKAMEKAVKEGKVKSIGLSNYNEKEFAEMMKIATIPPAVVQSETHPYNQRKDEKVFFDKYGTVLESWYPLGGRNRYGRGGKDTLFNDSTIISIAKKYNKTPAQVILRWHLQAGNIAIPGSSNPAHIKENIEIFDFNLSNEDMKKMEALDKKQRFSTF
ncbi:aldo/keto reductase [Fusobacterium sp. 1001295B_180824_G3]|uniref:aldo/keto reductase n=1 Tax=Fusobacterium sp. 1001295B_180824_G3 TaxID=2787123 RepID=UPI00189921E9|nr:aldo/keto reductase [Fusobacterium sp. 1001295B_180824_G3]